MAAGQAVCEGRPEFLKSTYGVGYNLIITRNNSVRDQGDTREGKDQEVKDGEEGKQREGEEGEEEGERGGGGEGGGGEMARSRDVAVVMDAVKRHVSEATVISSVGTEIQLQLPLSRSACFENLFKVFFFFFNFFFNTFCSLLLSILCYLKIFSRWSSWFSF